MTDEATAPAEAPKKEKAPKIEANGITRPKDGTTTGKVWLLCDQISASAGKPAERGEVIAAGKALAINEATIATQHGRWRAFHGLKGRTVKPKIVTETPAPTAVPVSSETASNETVVE